MGPKVTVTLGSSRPGGLDITLAGLCRQTFEDFEIVFVDGRYHKRHSEVLQAVRDSGLKQPFFHVPNYRYSPGPFGTTCAGVNTGFSLAAGDITVILLDYAYCPPGWLQAHVDHAGKLAMAGAEYRTLVNPVALDGKPLTVFDRAAVDDVPFDIAMDAIEYQRTRIDEISCFAKPFEPQNLDWYPLEESDIKCTMKTGKHEYYGLNTKNESAPTEKFLEVNGMRELADCGRIPADPDLGWRLVKSGLEPWLVAEAKCYCLNPRRILPNMNLVHPEQGNLPPPYDNRVSVELGNALYEHWKQSGEKRAPNPVDLYELRDRLWHWRELSQRTEPVIPKNVISDGEHFRKMVAAA